jgi:sec-independent protein translocase protein TatA
MGLLFYEHLIGFSQVDFKLSGERILTMFDIGVPELLIVLVVVVLVFGPGRLARTMGEIGKGIRAFKESVSSKEGSPSVSDTNVDSKQG